MLKRSLIILVAMVLSALLVISGCGTAGKTAVEGDVVQVHYTGTLTDGIVFDSSIDREPIEFTLGEGQMIPGFEKAVLGMKIGEKKTVTIPASEAYGPRNTNLVIDVPRETIPAELDPEIGKQLQMTMQDGMIAIVTIIGMTDSTITLDGNPPLAGKDLIFEIELVDIL